MSVVIETTVGIITVDLFIDERPIGCLNFLKLCKLKYFNFNLFHTIQQDFIAQTGDPTGAGDGGSSIWGVIEGSHKRFVEAENLPKINHSSVGLLSLVSPGKHLVGSQFFFTLGSDLISLDGKHCVIGQVVEGHETLRRLNEAIVDDKFRPYQDIRVTHTVILDDPFPDMRGFQAPSRSPSPSAERLQNGRIPADEDIDDTDGKSLEEIQEMLAEREAKARATILEIVGDLPDAEMAPPENVLFVCKLNPVTTDDDLEIIFSRFGKVKNCEVIRDRKTGDSLQYAFVEFEEQKSCEAAYFKMDNVLIDDRRIHVDFSQSVAKVKWRGKGRGVEGPAGRLDFNNLREKGSTKHATTSRNDRQASRLTSEERRKAREERHQAQRSRDHRQRSRSPLRKNTERRRESPRRECPRRESSRRESPRRESARRESPRREPTRREPPRRESPRRESPRRSPTRREPTRREPTRRESPRRESPRRDYRRPERNETGHRDLNRQRSRSYSRDRKKSSTNRHNIERRREDPVRSSNNKREIDVRLEERPDKYKQKKSNKVDKKRSRRRSSTEDETASSSETESDSSSSSSSSASSGRRHKKHAKNKSKAKKKSKRSKKSKKHRK